MNKLTKIVLVDDDEDLCNLLKMQLEALHRFAVTASSHSDGALELIKKERPDLAILDINMPEIHGVELAAALAHDEETAGVPVLYLTGMASPEEIAHIGGGHSPQTLISKQSPISELIAAIDSLTVS